MVRICFVIMFITLSLFIGCSEQEQEEVVVKEQTEEPKIIVAAGDSLTAGYGIEEPGQYPYLLENKLQASGYNYEVINAGVSAETSSGLLSRLEWLLTLDPDIVILETGANDGLRGVDPELVENNIRQIINKLQEKDIVVLLAGMKMVWNLGPLYVKQFNRIYPRLADETEVLFFPFFLEDVAMKAELNLQDNLHPNDKGYEKIVDNIFPYVLDAIIENERQ